MMKKFVTAAAILSAASLMVAAPAAAQDSESYVLGLSGSVASNCELVPEGSGTFNVNMLNTGNQGSLAIVYSCNSPYTVSLQSLNGGMKNVTSGGVVNIDYDVEASFFGFGATSTNSAAMQAAPVTIVTNNDWENIATNGGARAGNLDLSFDNIGEFAVAGEYEDQLTIKLAANF